MTEVFTEPAGSGDSWDSKPVSYRPISSQDAQKYVVFLQLTPIWENHQGLKTKREQEIALFPHMNLYKDLMIRNTAVKEVIFPVVKMSISNAESVSITVSFPLPHLSIMFKINVI